MLDSNDILTSINENWAITARDFPDLDDIIAIVHLIEINGATIIVSRFKLL